jgi:hypothetical protein
MVSSMSAFRPFAYETSVPPVERSRSADPSGPRRRVSSPSRGPRSPGLGPSVSVAPRSQPPGPDSDDRHQGCSPDQHRGERARNQASTPKVDNGGKQKFDRTSNLPKWTVQVNALGHHKRTRVT